MTAELKGGLFGNATLDSYYGGAHPLYRAYFLRIRFYASGRDKKIEKFARRHAEHTLIGVQLYARGPKTIESFG